MLDVHDPGRRSTRSTVVPEIVEGIKIIHDDDSIVVIDKPVGVAVHPSPGLVRPDRRRPPRRRRLPDRHQRRLRAPGHRAAPRRRHLGRDGDLQVRARLLACSRTPSGTARSTRPTTRWCRATPTRSRAPIDAPIGRHPKADYKFAVMADGRHSVTHYETLEAHRFASLLEVHLETGRTHQIRVHMAALKHPCVGDLTYGADPSLAKRVGLRAAVAARRAPRLRAPRHRRARRVRVDLPRRPGRTPSRSSAMPTDGAPDGRRCSAPATPDDADALADALHRAARRGRPPMPPRRAHRRRGPGLARPAAAARRDEVWVAEARRRPGRLRPARPTAWLDDLYVAPGRRRAAASARRCSTWSRPCAPTASACGSSRRNTRARALLRAPRAGRARAHRRRRPTRSGRPTSGWPGRARTRWRSTAA